MLGKEELLLGVPIGAFDVIINGLQWLADTFKSEKLEDAAIGRIGRYYAIEDMLTTEPSEKYGQTMLRQDMSAAARDRSTTLHRFGKAAVRVAHEWSNSVQKLVPDGSSSVTMSVTSMKYDKQARQWQTVR